MPKRFDALMRWYAANGRHDLPWRRTRDPYAIFMSEAMLQQTQVDRVRSFYAAWLRRFPHWPSLARAKTDALVRAWAGLGYNRRALYVREAAKRIVKNGLPASAAEWEALPGMGPYASSAVFSFIKRIFIPAVDTNVRRVIGRLFLGIPAPASKDDRRILAFFEKTKRDAASARHHLTYALMDFGSAICTAKRPQCETCPFRTRCRSKNRLADFANVSQPKMPFERRHEGKPHPDRIYRGRILALVRDHRRVDERSVGTRVDPSFNALRDGAWMSAMIGRLVRDGFLVRKNSELILSRT